MLKYVVKVQVRAAQARNERGATAVEYGLMVALVAVAILGGVSLLGRSLAGMFGNIAANPMVW